MILQWRQMQSIKSLSNFVGSSRLKHFVTGIEQAFFSIVLGVCGAATQPVCGELLTMRQQGADTARGSGIATDSR
jgi:hypothetical protein